MIFRDERHEQLYKEFLHRMYSRDCYFRPVAYLLSLDTVCREHAAEIFDFDDGSIRPASLSKGWQTGKAVKLADWRLTFSTATVTMRTMNSTATIHLIACFVQITLRTIGKLLSSAIHNIRKYKASPCLALVYPGGTSVAFPIK